MNVNSETCVDNHNKVVDIRIEPYRCLGVAFNFQSLFSSVLDSGRVYSK